MERHPSPLERDFSLTTLMHAKLRAEERLAPARDVMDKLSELLSTKVILAGGAVRDALLERPIKDYDLFVSEDVFPAWKAIMDGDHAPGSFADHVSTWAIPLVSGTYEDTAFGSEIASIYEFPHPDTGTEVQVMFLRKAVVANQKLSDYVSRMDLGLSKVAVRSDGDWYISEQFREDVRNRNMTFVARDLGSQDVERSTRRFTRLHNKYPGYTFVVPEELATQG